MGNAFVFDFLLYLESANKGLRVARKKEVTFLYFLGHICCIIWTNNLRCRHTQENKWRASWSQGSNKIPDEKKTKKKGQLWRQISQVLSTMCKMCHLRSGSRRSRYIKWKCDRINSSQLSGWYTKRRKLCEVSSRKCAFLNRKCATILQLVLNRWNSIGMTFLAPELPESGAATAEKQETETSIGILMIDGNAWAAR